MSMENNRKCVLASCSIEDKAKDSRSLGPVKGGELICRAVFDPIHYSGGKIKTAFIRAAHLLNGELSAWRLDSDKSQKAETLIADMQKNLPTTQAGTKVSLFAVLAVTASNIRKLKSDLEIIGRVLVLDECKTDEHGGYDPRHVHISGCRRKVGGYDSENLEFVKFRDALKALYVQQDLKISGPPEEAIPEKESAGEQPLGVANCQS